MVKDHAGPPPLRRSFGQQMPLKFSLWEGRAEAVMPEPEDLPFCSDLLRIFRQKAAWRTDKTPVRIGELCGQDN